MSKIVNRKEFIYDYLMKHVHAYPDGMNALQISEETGFTRENVSRELNRLVRENRVCKKSGRPVHYSPINATLSKKSVSADPINHPSDSANVFKQLVGYDGGIKKQVKQAIAAVLYPPKGLHTLLYGPTGIGKTTFARIMHSFALESNRFKKDAPFIVFNCADYSGNSQLLMSHLFGHVKGAFTGADDEKQGLIQLADDGVLFLDEVHRLPPEGQEMLFSILDTGEYRRLGETANTRTTSILLIAATTENPNHSILGTFLRRIPSLIEFESLLSRPLEERLQLISRFFYLESLKVKTRIHVSVEVMKLLLIYDCPGNIGQLQNDIQLICANAFVDYMFQQETEIYVKLSNISDKHTEFFNIYGEKREDVSKALQSYGSRDFIYDPKKEEIEKISVLDSDGAKEVNFYKVLKDKSKEFFEQGLSHADVKKTFNEEFHMLFRSPQKDQEKNVSDQEAVFKVVSKSTYFVVENILNELSYEFEITFNKEILYGLALHVETLLERLNNGSVNDTDQEDKQSISDPKVKQMAGKIRTRLEESFTIQIPKKETTLIALLLSTMTSISDFGKIGIIVLMHGESAATDLANTANTLLDTQHAKALNMPLKEKVSTVLEKTTELVRKVDQGRGVLILADMGSLVAFGEVISERTGIEIRTIKMVTTPMVIEATRKALVPDLTLSQLVDQVEKSSNLIGYSVSASTNDLEKERTRVMTIDEKKIKKVLENAVSFINLDKAYDFLGVAIDNIGQELRIEEMTSFRVKMMFHCSCMLERVIRNDALDYPRETSSEMLEMLPLIKEEFDPIGNSFGILIPESEYNYIAEIILIHQLES